MRYHASVLEILKDTSDFLEPYANTTLKFLPLGFAIVILLAKFTPDHQIFFLSNNQISSRMPRASYTEEGNKLFLLYFISIIRTHGV